MNIEYYNKKSIANWDELSIASSKYLTQSILVLKHISNKNHGGLERKKSNIYISLPIIN